MWEAFQKDAAVIINPAGFSFGSIPVLDALKLIQKPLVEVHITNITNATSSIATRLCRASRRA